MSPAAMLRHEYSRRERRMAEEKTEETKPVVPRRVARPFIGPAGASTATRPLSRPSTPGERPRPAAFLPALAPDRPTLGAVPRTASLPPAVVPHATAPSVDPNAIVPIIEVPATPAFEASVGASPIDLTPVEVDDRPIVHVDDDATVEAVSDGIPQIDPAHNAAHSRPVTSEMVAVDALDALDALDAFDAVWGAPGSPDRFDVTLDASPAAAPLDPVTLGTGIDAQQVWGDEITCAPEPTISISDHAESMEGHPDASELARPDAGPADSGMPPWNDDGAAVVGEPAITSSTDVIDDVIESMDVEPSGFDASARVDDGGVSWPDPLLAEYAPYIPTPVSQPVIAPPLATMAGADSADAVETEPAYEAQALAHLVDVHAGSFPDDHAPSMNVEATDRQLDTPEPPTVNVAAPAVRTSAALERLAERVRSGEIDVSSVAAGASDTAVLASVLAALLGGSSSR